MALLTPILIHNVFGFMDRTARCTFDSEKRSYLTTVYASLNDRPCAANKLLISIETILRRPAILDISTLLLTRYSKARSPLSHRTSTS